MCTKNWNIPFEKPNNGETLFGKIIIVSQHMLKKSENVVFSYFTLCNRFLLSLL